MNPTLYTQLAPLGFAEWLYKYEIQANARCKIIDELDIDDINRTQFNSLAFRWLREEKGINVISPTLLMWSMLWQCRIIDIKSFEEIKNVECHDTHQLAEHEALNKALEILNKGGENGL